MKNQDDPFVQKWKKTREKGLLKHMLSTGLSFGILLFVILSVYDYFIADKSYASTYDFVIQLVICVVIGGGFYALMTWFLNELMYKRKTKE
jgi:O-antigen/teichoic acid export membrane protein